MQHFYDKVDDLAGANPYPYAQAADLSPAADPYATLPVGGYGGYSAGAGVGDLDPIAAKAGHRAGEGQYAKNADGGWDQTGVTSAEGYAHASHLGGDYKGEDVEAKF